MSQKVTFNFVIGMGGKDVNPAAEIDSRSAEDGGLNAKFLGKTSGFSPTDSVYFLLWRAGLTVVKTHVNIGTVGLYSAAVRYSVKDRLTFNTADGLEASLSKAMAADSGLTVNWFGTAPGSVTAQGQKAVLQPLAQYKPGTDGMTAYQAERTRLAAAVGGIADISYLSAPDAYKITLPNEASFLANGGTLGEDFPVIVTIFLMPAQS